jgi:hypothetical protein
MSELARKFKADRTETILSFVWQQWSRIGGGAAGGRDGDRIVDPEPLLLLTLEVARQDPRMFDSALDWLIVNGRWLNVVRLTALSEKDKVCDSRILGAVAAIMTQHDRTPKWKALARRYKPDSIGDLAPLFNKNGKPMLVDVAESDPIFASYGFLRGRFTQRSLATSVLTPDKHKWSASEFMFRSRALFGVNIRADVFSYLALRRAANPTRIARELGYSQRRVQDALVDMAASGVFKARTVGKSKEYVFNAGVGWGGIMGGDKTSVEWRDWRALARAFSVIWRVVVAIKEELADEYIINAEEQAAFREARDDLIAAEPGWNGSLKETFVPRESDAWT